MFMDVHFENRLIQVKVSFFEASRQAMKAELCFAPQEKTGRILRQVRE